MALTFYYNGVEVTSEAFGVNFRCGRNRTIDEFAPVSGSVMFRNFNGAWAPPFLATPSYLLLESGDQMLQQNDDGILLEQSVQASGGYGEIQIGGSFTINDGAVRIFTGHVEEVEYQYHANGYADARVILGDGLTTLANSWIGEDWVPVNDQFPGDRLHELMSRPGINFPAVNRDFDKGFSTLQGGYFPVSYFGLDPDDAPDPVARHTVAIGTNVLQYAQLIAQSDHGRLYIDRDGTVHFRGRYDFPSASPTVDFDDTGTGGNIAFAGVDIDYGSELLRSSVSVQRLNGTARSAESVLELPEALGERNLTLAGLLVRFDPVCEARASHLVNQYAAIDARVAGLKIILDDLSTADRAAVAALDINDTVSWTWTPPGAGAEVSQTLIIEGREFVSELYGNTYINFQLSAYPNTNYFVIDTDTIDGGVPIGF